MDTIINKFEGLGALQDVETPETDAEGNPHSSTHLITTRAPHQVARIALKERYYIMTVAGNTSGTGNFYGDPKGKNVLAIKVNTVTEPTETTSEIPALNEFHITDDGSVIAGAGIPIGHLRKAVNASEKAKQYLQKEKGIDAKNYCFSLPHDPTTQFQAQIGAPTGAQGPTRVRISDMVDNEQAAYIFDGQTERWITKEELKIHEGLLGTTIMILALRFRPIIGPKHEFGALFSPTNEDIYDGEAEVATALQKALINRHNIDMQHPWADGHGIALGLEEVDKNALDLSHKVKGNSGVWKDYLEMVKKRQGLYLSFRHTNKKLNEILAAALTKYNLEEVPDTINPTEYSEIAAPDDNNPAEILIYLYLKGKITYPYFTEGRDVKKDLEARESIPVEAKEQHTAAKRTQQSFSTSWDANTYIDPEIDQQITEEERLRLNKLQLDPYRKLDQKVTTVIEETKQALSAAGLDENTIQIFDYSYGHLNMRGGTDIHKRFTVIAKRSPEHQEKINEIFKETSNKIKAAFNELANDLVELRKISAGKVIVEWGEKGKIVKANMKFLTPKEADEALKAIQNAPKGMSWRVNEAILEILQNLQQPQTLAA